MNFASTILQLVPLLHADTPGNLSYWTEAELYDYLADSIIQASRTAALRAQRSLQNLVAEQSQYNRPAGSIDVLSVAANGVELHRVSRRDIDALGPRLDMLYWTPDFQSLSAITLHGAPSSSTASGLEILTTVELAAPTAGVPSVACPQLAAEAAFYAAIAGAREKEGDGLMPEVAAAARELEALVSSAIQTLWGNGE